MELQKFLLVIWRRLWLILLATMLVAGMTYYLSISTTPVYQASTILEITQGIDPRIDTYTALRTSELAAKTYVEQLKAPKVMREVAAALQLHLSPGELQKMISVQQVRDTQLIKITVENPDPVLAKEIADKIAETFIQQNMAKQQARFEAGLKDLNDQIAALEASIDETQKAIASLGDPMDPRNINMPEFARLELVRLESDLARDQTRYVILLKSVEDFRLAAARYSDDITVFSPAEIPRTPAKPRTFLNTILGLISGLVLGVSTAFLLEHLDEDIIRTSEDVSEALGLTTLANIARIKGIKRLRDGLIMGLGHSSPIAEAYRALRTNLRFSSADNPLKSIVVTSARPGEGKTTTLVNLGVVIAQAGRGVILVDTDLRHPTLHRFFELDVEPGLTDLLLDERLNVETALQKTEMEGLSVLPSGPMHPNPAELLDSPQMMLLIEKLKEKAEVMLFDSPPVLAVTDASVLSNKTEGVLLTIEAGVTSREVARGAKEALDKVGAKVLGVVLNKQEAGRGSYYYRYRYSGAEGRKR